MNPTDQSGGAVRSLQRGEWEQLARATCDYSYTQSWDYAHAAAKSQRAAVEAVAIEAKGQALGLAMIRVKKLPLIGGGLAYVSGGPLVRRGAAWSDCLAVLRAEYAERRKMVLRVLAPIGPPEWNETACAGAAGLGLQPAPTGRGYRTIIVDMAREEDAIKAACSQRWRRGLSQSRKQGLVLLNPDGDDAMPRFVAIYDRMVERKQFTSEFDATFYADLQQRVTGPERLVVLIAQLNGADVGGVVLSMLGDTSVYLLGATDDTGRDARAAYLLHWRAIELAREKGLRWYDLGGIDDIANPGVTTFKRGMGGVEVVAAGPLQATPSGLQARAVLAAERAYRWARRRGEPPAAPVESAPAPGAEPA